MVHTQSGFVAENKYYNKHMKQLADRNLDIVTYYKYIFNGIIFIRGPIFVDVGYCRWLTNYKLQM